MFILVTDIKAIRLRADLVQHSVNFIAVLLGCGQQIHAPLTFPRGKVSSTQIRYKTYTNR
jgi:hypothetical protein